MTDTAAQTHFEKNGTYTRAEVAEMINLPEERRGGGAWMTGYSYFNGEFFIFCNVGVAGTTGDDYDNHWAGDLFHWLGNWKSHLGQSRFSQLLSAEATVHIFYRSDTRAPFTYAGMGRPLSAEGEKPVRVIWSFGD